MHRRKLGTEWNEGARQMWLRLARKGWSLDDLAERTEIKKPALHRYLYGDRRPERAPAQALQRVLKIDPTTFDLASLEAFITPAAQEEMDEVESKATGTG